MPESMIGKMAGDVLWLASTLSRRRLGSFEPRESGNLSQGPWMRLADRIWGWRSYGGSRLVSWIAETLVVLVSP